MYEQSLQKHYISVFDGTFFEWPSWKRSEEVSTGLQICSRAHTCDIMPVWILTVDNAYCESDRLGHWLHKIVVELSHYV